jgi:hypothetical protein
MDTNGVSDGGSTQGKPIKCKGSSPNHSIPIIFFSSLYVLLTLCTCCAVDAIEQRRWRGVPVSRW